MSKDDAELPELTIDGQPIDDFTVLTTVTPRLYKTRKGTSELAIEIIQGPYRGVVFAYTTFDFIDRAPDTNGFLPVRFDCAVYENPNKVTLGEDFDLWTREFLLTWLAYLQTSPNIYGFAKLPTIKGIH